MNPNYERKLRANWAFLKHELAVEDLSDKLVELGTFTSEIRYAVINVKPNTRFMKAEKFLQFIIESGDKGFDTLCNLLRRESDNMYKDVIEKLEISTDVVDKTTNSDKSKSGTTGTTTPARGSIIKQSSLAHRPVQDQSAENHLLTPTKSNETTNSTQDNENKSITQNKSEETNNNTNRNGDCNKGGQPISTNDQSPNKQKESCLPERSKPDGSSRNNSIIDEKKGFNAAGAAAEQVLSAAASSFSLQDNAFTVDMKDLEHELVRMAPQIAELFKKISRSNPTVKANKHELHHLKGENDRLRKANRSLVEKLNIFQQKIIHLQLENKRLRDSVLNSKDNIVDIMNRAEELADLEKKLTEQKRELDEKEREINEHLRKIEDIERENEEQKRQIIKLEKLHAENAKERSEQKEQITELKEDKERHQLQIEYMEDLQRKDEERFLRLEHRIRLLEQASMPRYRPNDKERRRATRVMSPPKAMPWMSGVVNRSHHANVKFPPPTDERESKEPLAPTEKEWAI